jgi:hypothetical protein
MGESGKKPQQSSERRFRPKFPHLFPKIFLNTGQWPWGVTQDERPIIILTSLRKNKIAAARGKLE